MSNEHAMSWLVDAIVALGLVAAFVFAIWLDKHGDGRS